MYCGIYRVDLHQSLFGKYKDYDRIMWKIDSKKQHSLWIRWNTYGLFSVTSVAALSLAAVPWRHHRPSFLLAAGPAPGSDCPSTRCQWRWSGPRSSLPLSVCSLRLEASSPPAAASSSASAFSSVSSASASSHVRVQRRPAGSSRRGVQANGRLQGGRSRAESEPGSGR